MSDGKWWVKVKLPVWVKQCWSKSLLVRKEKGHCLQKNFWVPSWRFMCNCKWNFCLNNFLHNSHFFFYSSAWSNDCYFQSSISKQFISMNTITPWIYGQESTLGKLNPVPKVRSNYKLHKDRFPKLKAKHCRIIVSGRCNYLCESNNAGQNHFW